MRRGPIQCFSACVLTQLPRDDRQRFDCSRVRSSPAMVATRIYAAAVVTAIGTIVALLISEPASDQMAPSWNWEHQFKAVLNA